MNLVIRIGGSVVAAPLNPEAISKFAEILKTLKVQGHKVVAVVGGGTFARDLIKTAKQLGLNMETQDKVAISASRIVAQLLSNKLGNLSCKEIPTSINEATLCLKQGNIAVMGGIKPSMTTDTVAALVAEKTQADILVKATDQDGVYTKDPKKHADAKKIETISFKELSKLLKQNRHKAGIHQILDPEAIKILQKNRIKVVIVNGFKPENVLLAVKGEKVGTLIE